VRHRFGPATVIGPPDFGISDYSAPIIARELISAPDRFCSIWRQAMAELPSADLFHVSKIPRCIGRHSNPLLSWPGLRRKVTRSWSVELPDSWAHYESLLSSKARGAFRRYHRRLQEIGSVTHVVADDDVSAGRIFDALCAHREARFSKLGRPDILRSAPHREFYREVIQRSLTSGPALLSALMVDSEIVATMLGLRWRDTYMALIPTMAEGDAFQKYGVGKLMNWLQMKEMHARGCRHFDFTIGNEPYKRDYGAQPRELYDMVQPLKVQGYPLAWAFRIRAGLQLWREAAPPVS
jgi:CelD/BcsL family acetyltransferase involved in cellulose biosynthesis